LSWPGPRDGHSRGGMSRPANPLPSPGMGAAGREPIVIGVLTWNGYDLARGCIASLSQLNGWPIPVVVVDNGSREPEGKRLAAEFGPPVEAVTLPENQLTAGGYNALIRRAAERGASHILLLNNDTRINDPEMLDRLVAAADSTVAAVGPRVLNEDGSHFSAGGTLGRWTGRADHLLRRQMPAEDRPYDVTWVDGPCMLISVKVACLIGGLDPAFVSTWEELDWCIRAREAGYRCVVEPRTTISHLRGRTIPSRQSQMYMYRNSILFARRHAGWPQTVTAAVSFVFLTLPEHVAHNLPSLRGVGRVLATAFVAFKWNIADAIRQRAWHRPASGPEVCGDVPRVN
jgi:GT2 family glycosyltransferase